MSAARIDVNSPRDYSVQLDIPDLKNPRNSIPVKNDPEGTRVYLNSLIVLASGRMIFGIACINANGEHIAMEESKAILQRLGEAGLRNVTVDAIKVGGDRVKRKIQFFRNGGGRSRVNSIPEAEEVEDGESLKMDKLAIDESKLDEENDPGSPAKAPPANPVAEEAEGAEDTETLKMDKLAIVDTKPDEKDDSVSPAKTPPAEPQATKAAET
jgi:hypothetical protein